MDKTTQDTDRRLRYVEPSVSELKIMETCMDMLARKFPGCDKYWALVHLRKIVKRERLARALFSKRRRLRF